MIATETPNLKLKTMTRPEPPNSNSPSFTVKRTSDRGKVKVTLVSMETIKNKTVAH